jgi:Tol biopolymer transport system component/C-terminal processing protease CtpA/Prc
MRQTLQFLLSSLLLTLALAPAVPGAALATEALWLRYPAISPDGETLVFSYRGDLWRVPATGGTATVLTRHAADDTHPVWSPDGSRIAFASDRYGNFDIWVLPATGGEAERLTYHSADDVPSAFTPDGQSVLFRSARLDAIDSVQYPTGAQPELYAVDLNGGLPRQVLTTPALYAVHDPSGRWLAYSDRKGYENEFRKHDNSSFARDLWLLDTQSGEHRRLTEFGHDDRQPVWSPDGKALYFLSERSGSFNVWRLAIDHPGEATPVTHHDRHPVRSLSLSAAGDVAYAYDGALYVQRAGQSAAQRLTIHAPADRRSNAVRFTDVAQEITELAVSPDGQEIAFIARGEVFVTATDHTTTRRITDTAEQERSLSFAPDGRGLLYAGERGGSWNLYQARLTDPEEPNFFNASAIEETALLESEAETFQPRFSPDGLEVAYLQERTELRVLNLASGETRTILPRELNYSYIDGDQWFDWSPDGRHFLVQFMSPTRWSTEVGLVSSAGGGEVINLTHSGYEDFLPRWTHQGHAMLWQTDRFGDRMQAGWPSDLDLRLGFFTQEAWERYRMTAAEYKQWQAKKEKADQEEKKAKAQKAGKDPGEDDEADPAPKLADPVDLDPQGFEDRTVRLTIHSSNLVDAALTTDGERLLYLARSEKGYDLWSYQHRDQEIKLLAKLDAKEAGRLQLDAKGERAFLLVDRTLATVDLKSGEVKPVQLTAAIDLDAPAERAYLFEHVWRQTWKKFHDVTMHGVDWAYYKEAYARFLPHVETPREFAELLSEMLGELNASHTGAGYRSQAKDADETASLGFFPDPDWSGDGIRIAEILKGSPLQRKGTKIAPGTVLEAIDGTPIPAGSNWIPLLNRKAEVPVRLALSDPDSGTRWEERVKPIPRGEERALLYDRWVESRRHEVERLSGGRIGYAHIRGMDDRSFREIFEDIFGRSVTKEAIVLDTRFNGGGNLDEALTVFLSGQVFMRAVPRGQEVGSAPQQRWTKPSIVVVNEGNYSDAHCFPNAYRTLGLGETVGMQVPGTCTSVWWELLQDRTLRFGIPQVTWLDSEGDPLENKHFDPDHVIDNDPQLEAEGRDQQLEKAVEVLLQGL